jgi:hypothetical protein
VPKLITAADVIGVVPQLAEPNRHLANRLPSHLLRSLSRAGRHRRRTGAPGRPSDGTGALDRAR